MSVGSPMAEKENPLCVDTARDGDERKPDSQATQIIRVVKLTKAELFHTPAGDPYLTVPVGDHVETYALFSRACRSWLNQIFSLKTGKSPSTNAIQAATNTMA